jgi:hypothetical protein
LAQPKGFVNRSAVRANAGAAESRGSLLRYLAAVHWLRFLDGGLVALGAADMVSKMRQSRSGKDGFGNIDDELRMQDR